MTTYVIDDHPMMREAIATLLRKLRPQKKIVEIEQVSALAAAIKVHGAPAFFYLDLMLPDTIGVSGIRHLKNLYPSVPLAVVSGSPAGEWQERCVAAGADVFINKAADSVQIEEALKGIFLTAEEGLRTPAVGVDGVLSERQLQILVMLSKGMSNGDVAQELGLHEKSVTAHLWRLYKRINVKSRTQAILYARTKGLL